MVQVLGQGRLVYGMQLPVQSQSSLFAESWEADAGARELAEIARTADRSGFAYIASCDHVAIPRRLARAMGTTWYDPVATLSFLAGVTERVRLLSHVAIVGLRHPLVTAKQYATLDHLSGGRLILGVGAGHVEEEFDALGADFAGRGGVLNESIDALKAALGQDEYPEHHGERYQFSGLGQRPRPAQERVPIWVGGSSPAAVRRAATRADGWLPQGDPRTKLPAKIAKLKELRAEAGIEAPITIGTIVEPLYLGEPDWEVGRWTLSGKPEAIAASLREFKAMGVHQIQIRFRSRSVDELTDQMAAFGAEVAPHLND
ncbi:TIGR03619 family F420-dependent LLM class oxidoreductase [Streptomyces sp. NBC_01304]|uniref:TIGR03619 family F420-dependent LLM class oxidoreductase n=1 Tax=Streptomyces sp. NBC_01304 TaxID=2903818 RepID=UPI002E101FB6|nr:TIGR03619 family F420-dependent LLM class oxidoreductase [Streptomyces sp. NBC_01304]